MSTAGEIEIVVVEDDPNDAELIIRVLKKHNLANKLVHLEDGAKAIEFFLGKEAEQYNREHGPPKVILLDLKLPKIDGIEVLRQLKADERTRHIPVVILTSSREESDLEKGWQLGVNSYVTKPIKFDEFSKVVTDLGLYWLLLNKPLDE